MINENNNDNNNNFIDSRMYENYDYRKNMTIINMEKYENYDHKKYAFIPCDRWQK